MDETQEVVRDASGKWLVPPKSPAPITHANARSMALKRWEKYRQAAVKRIVGEAQSIDPDVQTPADAFGLVAAKQYTTLMDSEKPRIGDLEKLGQIMTGISSEPRRENASESSDSAIVAQPAALIELAAAMERELQHRLDQARAIDTTMRSE